MLLCLSVLLNDSGCPWYRQHQHGVVYRQASKSVNGADGEVEEKTSGARLSMESTLQEENTSFPNGLWLM